jgi:hypothetical protein
LLTTESQLLNTVPNETSTPISTTPTSSESGLSPGAKAAIGVLIPLLFIALLSGVFFYFRRTSQRKRDLPNTYEPYSKIAVEADPDTAVIAELGDETQIIPGVYELSSGHAIVLEMAGSDLPHSSVGKKWSIVGGADMFYCPMPLMWLTELELGEWAWWGKNRKGISERGVGS